MKRQHQTGVVTLLGAVFILVVMAVLAQTLNRLSASGLIDSAVQQDTVEALFIAESGVEYASSLYARGTTCVALSAVGSTPVGRGSFEITNAFMVNGDCRVQVRAAITPLSVGATAATRIVQADLRLAGGEGWAVGDNGAMLRWDGVSWNAVASVTTRNLNSVHCINANDCWAVGDNSTVLHWNGAAWSAVPVSNNRQLTGVSCPPLTSTACQAVGYWVFFGPYEFGAALRWNGSNWQNTPVFMPFNRFNAVACTSATCFGVSNWGSVRDASSGWFPVYGPTPGAPALNGIDCPADDQCWAVGALSGNSYSLVRFSAGTWSPLTVPASNQGRSDLNAVSCATADDCWAVGDRRNSRYVLLHWSGGNWSATLLRNGQHRENLNGIHCALPTDCWAVGDQRNGWNLIHYDGVSWSYIGAAAPGGENLNDVYLSGGGGTSGVSLVRWRELVVN